MAREATFWPREAIQKAEGRDPDSDIILKEPEDDGEVGMSEELMPEEPEEAKLHRLQRAQDQISLIMMILHHRNYVSDDEKLRQIRVVVD